MIAIYICVGAPNTKGCEGNSVRFFNNITHKKCIWIHSFSSNSLTDYSDAVYNLNTISISKYTSIKPYLEILVLTAQNHCDLNAFCICLIYLQPKICVS